jgi:hypothetical protein
MAVIYVIQENRRLDFSAAEQYGKLRFLLPEDASPFMPKMHLEALKTGLRDFTDKDFLLLVGSPCFIAWAFHYAAMRCPGGVNLLQWQRTPGHYVIVRAEL